MTTLKNVPGTLYLAERVEGHPGASAVLEREGRIAWIGPRDAHAGDRSADRVVDLGDAAIAPGFVDAHVHVTATGLAQTGLDLSGSGSLAEALRRVEDHTRRARGGVVLGTGWDETTWPEQRPPTAKELDRASAGSVVYLARTDVHSAVVSSALLAAVPEARALPGFQGDGLVRTDAHHAVRRAALASISPAQRGTAQRAALDHMARVGITTVHECGGPDISGEEDFVAVLGLEHPVRRVGLWGELHAVAKSRDLGAVGAAGDLFVDGALGSRTACLSAPYLGGSETGHCYLSVEEAAEHLRACTEVGVPGGFHVIGDQAIQLVVEALELVAGALGDQALRAAGHRLEHVEMVTPEQIRVLARLGVAASVQPAFDARWGGPGGMYAQRLGDRRAAGMNPFRAMADAGVRLLLGSDAPVTPPDPWAGIRAAVTHRTPGSALSLREAVAAHSGPPLRVGGQCTFAAWEVKPFEEGQTWLATVSNGILVRP